MAKAERLLAEELRRRKVRPEDWAGRPKGDRPKTRIALRLRAETPITWDWIAEKLAMGVGAPAAHGVRVLKARKENGVIRDPFTIRVHSWFLKGSRAFGPVFALFAFSRGEPGSLGYSFSQSQALNRSAMG